MFSNFTQRCGMISQSRLTECQRHITPWGLLIHMFTCRNRFKSHSASTSWFKKMETVKETVAKVHTRPPGNPKLRLDSSITSLVRHETFRRIWATKDLSLENRIKREWRKSNFAETQSYKLALDLNSLPMQVPPMTCTKLSNWQGKNVADMSTDHDQSEIFKPINPSISSAKMITSQFAFV